MKFKPITIHKMFNRNQFGIRSDILARHKAYSQALIVDTPLGRVEIAPENKVAKHSEFIRALEMNNYILDLYQISLQYTVYIHNILIIYYIYAINSTLKRCLWRSITHLTPIRFCYFAVKEEQPDNQTKLFEVPATNAPQRLKELQGMLK